MAKFQVNKKAFIGDVIIITEVKRVQKKGDEPEAMRLKGGEVIELSEAEYRRLFLQESGPLYPRELFLPVAESAPKGGQKEPDPSASGDANTGDKK